jgi:hypothetical protein
MTDDLGSFTVSDLPLAARLASLGAPMNRLEFRRENDEYGIGLNGDRAWVPFRASKRATLLDLVTLLEHDRDEPLRQAAKAKEKRRWVTETLKAFEQRLRRSGARQP